LTKLDILNHFDSINVCTQYQKEDLISDDYSEFMHDLDKVKPIYEKINGWNCDIKNINSFKALPINAQKYVEYIQKLLGVKVKIISIGPERNQIIKR